MTVLEKLIVYITTAAIVASVGNYIPDNIMTIINHPCPKVNKSRIRNQHTYMDAWFIIYTVGT